VYKNVQEKFGENQLKESLFVLLIY